MNGRKVTEFKRASKHTRGYEMDVKTMESWEPRQNIRIVKCRGSGESDISVFNSTELVRGHSA